MREPKLEDIAAEWNLNASARCQQLDAGLDISHDQVLLPTFLRLAGDLLGRVVLDVGCGCGFLARAVARRARRVVAIDISERMIEEAKKRSSKITNITFEVTSVEQFARENARRFDVCVSNMSLMTMPHLNAALHAMARILKFKGRLVFSIGHPCFWNSYRNDESKEQFDYWESHSVVAPFRITLDQNPLPQPTTYFHRPLSAYLSSMGKCGLQAVEVIEPRPPARAPAKYRRGYGFPRFVVFLAQRQKI